MFGRTAMTPLLILTSLLVHPLAFAQHTASDPNARLIEEARRKGVVVMGTFAHTEDKPYTLEELIDKSDIILRTKLAERATFLAQGFVWTEFGAEVEEVLYNPKQIPLGDKLTVVRRGGIYSFESNRIHASTPGLPPWHSGQTYILFLVRSETFPTGTSDPNRFLVVGGAGGVFRLTNSGTEIEYTPIEIGRPRRPQYRPANEFNRELGEKVAAALAHRKNKDF